jgi:cation transport ATPase
MGADELREAQREARLEAAPFAAGILVANVALAVASHEAGWQLFGSDDWWIWLVFAVPSAVLVAIFALGPARLRLDRRRRELAIVMLILLGVGTAAAIASLVVSLAHWEPKGLQLLASAAVVLLRTSLRSGSSSGSWTTAARWRARCSAGAITPTSSSRRTRTRSSRGLDGLPRSSTTSTSP